MLFLLLREMAARWPTNKEPNRFRREIRPVANKPIAVAKIKYLLLREMAAHPEIRVRQWKINPRVINFSGRSDFIDGTLSFPTRAENM